MAPVDLVARVDLDAAYPPFLERYLELLARCRKRGADYYCIRLFSTYEYQDELHRQGRDPAFPGPIVTMAKGGQSFHNFGAGADACRDGIVDRRGLQMDWREERYAMLGEEAANVGLEWAGGWTRFRELAHVQFPGLNARDTLTQLDAAFRSEGIEAAWAVIDRITGARAAVA